MKTEFLYPDDIYNSKSAEKVLPLLLNFISLESVLDVGCGSGDWLQVLKKCGIVDLTGIDSFINIPSSTVNLEKNYCYENVDLSKPFDLGRKFDLIISLEVAEHLPDLSSDSFVNSLVKHGDLILFSAAIKGQGGFQHINEQPIQYWINKFKQHDYVFVDFFRNKIWEDNDIKWWYRQNMFLICKKNYFDNNKLLYGLDSFIFYVHPECFDSLFNELVSVKLILKQKEVEIKYYKERKNFFLYNFKKLIKFLSKK